MHGYQVFIEEIVSRKPLIGGHEIMQLLNLNSGPIVGELLRALEEARDLNEVVDRAQAETFAKNSTHKSIPNNVFRLGNY